MTTKLRTNYEYLPSLCLPGTEAALAPCEEEDRGAREDPGPSCGGVRAPSSRAEGDLRGDPTAGQEYSADPAFCPAALGSEESQELVRRRQFISRATFCWVSGFWGC